MAAKYAKIDRVDTLDADFQQVPLGQISEIFTIYFTIHFKISEEKQKIFFNIFFPKIQFTANCIGQKPNGLIQLECCWSSTRVPSTLTCYKDS